MTGADRALLFAAFSAALGFGTLIPLLPVYLAASDRAAGWHAGALPAVFLVAASLSAPLWGHLSDRVPRGWVVLAGLGGSVTALVPFLLQHSLATLYAFQALAGLSFGAVGPVALALLYETAPTGERARGVAWFGGATLAGYLAGPALGGWAAAMGTQLAAHWVVLLALGAQAALVATALVLVCATVRVRPALVNPATGVGVKPETRGRVAVGAALLAAFMVGGFEVATSLYIRSPLHFGARDVALLFMACSASMFIAQLTVLPRLSARAPRVELALGCITLSGVVLAAMTFVQAHAAVLALAALEGAALGLAVGLLSFEAASAGGPRRGLLLGYQNAAVNAGQAAGSAAGAGAFLMLGTAAFPALGALVVLAGALLSRLRQERDQ
jgi:predicted MFS family arabinose efflux permease